MNLTCQTQDVLFVQWARPEHFHETVDYYYLSVTSTEAPGTNLTLQTVKEHLETSISVANLTTHTHYNVQISAATVSPYTGRLIIGEPTEPMTIFMQPECDKIQQYMQQSGVELSAGVIAGLVCSVVALCVTFIMFSIWRKCFRASYYYLDDPPASAPTASLEWNTTSTDTSSGENKGAIPVSMFAKHVAQLHADGDIGFSKEYEAIQAETTHDECTSEHSQHPDNKAKNRYLNIIACKFSVFL